MSNQGYVYVLINPSMPGLVKVGRTERDPKGRALQLSSATGVATPFTVVYDEYFADAEEAETYVHTLLERHGYRVSRNREFFQAEVSEVIKAVAATPGKISANNTSLQSADDADLLISSGDDELSEFELVEEIQKNPADELYEEADMHYYGLGDYIQDHDEAFRIYKQAANLGSSDAYLQLGVMHSLGEGTQENRTKALNFFKEAIRKGNFYGYWKMAELFHDATHFERRIKHGLNFSTSSHCSLIKNLLA